MDKEYIKIVSTIHTGYNTYNGLLNEYDYTFFVLSTILFRKLGCVKLVDSEHLFYSSKIKNKDAISFFIDEYEKMIYYLDMVDDVIDEPGVPLYDVTELTAYILKLDQKLFDNYYVQMVEECLSIYFSKHHLTIQDSLQPQELNQLINYFLPEDKNISVYNPFAGMCSLGMNLSDDTNYLAEEINFDVAKLAELRFLISEKKNFEIKNTDSIKSLNEPFNNKYDFIVSTPPFGLKGKDALERVVMESNEYKIGLNSFIIDASLSKLKENGKIVFTISESVLYSSTKESKEFRRNLVLNSQIETLIKLPNRLFKSTGISSYIIVLSNDKKKNTSIRMIDASEMVLDVKSKQNILDLEKIFDTLNDSYVNDYCVFVNIEEIIKNDYNLSVKRYFDEDLQLTEKEKSNLEKLGDIVTLSKRERAIEKVGKFIKIGDLSKSNFNYSKTFSDVEVRPLRSDANLLMNNSILLSLAYTDLKPTFFSNNEEKIYYPYNNMLAFALASEKINSDYLIFELQKDYVKKQINSKRVGTAIQRISKKDLLNLKIVVPNLSEQLNEKYKRIQSKISEEKDSLNKLVKNYGIDVADENSFLRHQIAGTLKNVRGTFNAIKQIINEQIVLELPGVLDLKRSPKLETTLFDYINILERDITNINKSVNFVGQEIDLTALKVSKFNILDFLDKYTQEVENRGSNLFKIYLKIDEDLLIEKQVKGIFVNGDKEFLRRIFNNIIGNAEKHGFKNTINPENQIIIDIQYDFDNLEIQVDFGNSGNPFPENYTLEDFIKKGSKVGLNAGNGVGGWFINEVMKLHNGKLDFTNENETIVFLNNIVTTLNLTFPIELKL